MAIVRLGPIISGISGAIGSVVFVAGGRSTVARLRPITLHKTSKFLDAAKVRMQTYQNHWSTMSELQRDAWATAAANFQTTNQLGQSAPIGAFQLFIMVNARRRFASPNIQSNVPGMSILQPGGPTVVAFSESGNYDITAIRPEGVAAASYHFFGWPFWRNTPSREVARLVWLFNIGSNAPSVGVNIKARWLEHFGALREGQHFAAAVSVGGAPLSKPVIVRGVVVA